MPTELTYGRLADRAVRSVVAAAAAILAAAYDVDTARGAVAGYARLLGVAARHAAFLAGPTAPRDALGRRLHDELSAVANFAAAVPGPARPPSADWARAGDQLGSAHDILASHLGPDRDHRSSDAALLSDHDSVHAALRRLTQLAVTATGAGRPLATALLLAGEAHTDLGLQRGALQLRRAADAADSRLAAVRRQLIAAGTRGPLDELQVLPSRRLSPTPSHGDPLRQLTAAVTRVRLAAHRQRTGEQPVTTGSLLAHAQLAGLVLQAAKRVATQAARQLPAADRQTHLASAAAARAAAAPWRQVADSLRAIRVADAGDSLATRYQLTDVHRLVDQITGWRQPLTAAELPAALTPAAPASCCCPVSPPRAVAPSPGSATPTPSSAPSTTTAAPPGPAACSGPRSAHCGLPPPNGATAPPTAPAAAP